MIRTVFIQRHSCIDFIRVMDKQGLTVEQLNVSFSFS